MRPACSNVIDLGYYRDNREIAYRVPPSDRPQPSGAVLGHFARPMPLPAVPSDERMMSDLMADFEIVYRSFGDAVTVCVTWIAAIGASVAGWYYFLVYLV